MSQLELVFSFMQHILAQSHLSFKIHEQYDIVTILVFVAFLIGFIAISYAWWVDLGRERKYFRKLETHCGLNERGQSDVVMTSEALVSLLEQDRAAMRKTMVGRRIENILLALARHKDADSMGGSNGSSKRQAVAPPQMQDLHRMTQQLVFSRFAPTVARVIVSVLLILGICGTLWGVHGVLRVTNFEIKDMSTALNPSKFAVLFTIILAGMRGFYSAAVEKFIWKIDRLTMMHILPDLMPASDIGTAMQQFTQTVDELKARLEKMNSTTLSDASAKFSRTVDDFSGAATEFRAYVKKHSVSSEENQTKISAEIEAGNQHLREISELLCAVAQCQQVTKGEAEQLNSSMSRINEILKRFEVTGAVLETFSQEAHALREHLQNAVHVVQTENQMLADIQAAESSLNDTADKMSECSQQLAKQVGEYDATSHKIYQSAVSARISAEQTVAHSEEVSKKVEDLSAALNESDNHLKKLAKSAEDSEKQLHSKNKQLADQYREIEYILEPVLRRLGLATKKRK